MLSLLGLALTAPPAPSVTLWRIGQTDGKPLELGLAPGGYARYAADPLYRVGASGEREWPYVLPGPNDDWARRQTHRGEVVFGLDGVAPGGTCRLTVDFADTHPFTPPRLELWVNGKRRTEWQAPAGKSDDVVEGNAPTGKPAQWAVDLPTEALRNGNNTVEIRNVRGSWAVYDALRFEGPEGLRIVPVKPELSIAPLAGRQAILRTQRGGRQPLSVEVTNLGPATTGRLTGAGETVSVNLPPGRQTVELDIPPVKKAGEVRLRLTTPDQSTETAVRVQPVRPWTIYLFPHSHVDIGYTNLQTYIESLHQRNLSDAIAVADRNRANPPDSQFRFNVEAAWVLDGYLQTATPAQRATVQRALKDKTLALSASYANLLTGVMHPEELMQSYRYSRILGQRLGLDFDTASQTDVPGVTWGDVVALHEAGIRNLVLMPNSGDRVGGVHRAWRDRPFWWVGPSGRERVLVWQTDPYSVGVSAGWNGDRTKPMRTDHPTDRFIDGFIFDKLDRLAGQNYPYDIVGEPWSVQDNAPVDADVPVAAKAWNERYVTPHVVISTLSDACRELTRRYGGKLPVVRGDYTPYWEDGVGSSAAEMALNRISPDRLIQAETLFAMGAPDRYPADAFLDAWRNAILYSEHTWGAWNSVSQPDDPEVLAQWRIKRGFALTADAMSRDLLSRALGAEAANALEVRNTTSWPRTDLIRLTAEQSKAGDRVVDEAGRPLPSQRLRTGELAVLVRDVPPLGGKRLRVMSGEAYVDARATADGVTLRSDDYEATLDPQTGAIASLKSLRMGRELAQKPLNAFLYLPGAKLDDLKRNGRPTIEVVEPGPLVATLRATSDAPGAKGLTQEITLVAGLDRVEITDTIDKLPIREKEGVHFAFSFSVPKGQVRLDTPWALVRPETDQIAGANKNWLTSQAYADVSNDAFGVTWSSLDAPLLEVGEISANLLGSATDPDAWRAHIAPTQTLYSWALNNHWHTNYRADQAGPVTFRYVMRAHGAFRPDDALRLGVGARQPLLVGPASPAPESLFTIGDPTVVATRVVPSDDGKALIVRLFGTTPETRRVDLHWRAGLGAVTRTDLSQRPGRRLGNEVEVPGWGVLTIRVERNRP